MTKSHFMKNYLLKMAQSQYIPKINTLWQPIFKKIKMDFRQNLLLNFLLLKKSRIII